MSEIATKFAEEDLEFNAEAETLRGSAAMNDLAAFDRAAPSGRGIFLLPLFISFYTRVQKPLRGRTVPSFTIGSNDRS